MKINAYIDVVDDGDELVMRCRCGFVLGPASGDYKSFSLEARLPIQTAGPFANPYHVEGDRFELREHYCPSCLVLYEAEVARKGDPPLRDIELQIDRGGNSEW